MNGEKLASFLGLCNNYIALMPSFADVCDRLNKLSKDTKIQWCADFENFNVFKKKLMQPQVISLLNLGKNFVFETDASYVAVRAVLKQLYTDKDLKHPLAFFSRALTKTNKNSSFYKFEMYAVVRAVKH